MTHLYDSMSIEICAQMLTGHDAISSQSCLVHEFMLDRKNGLPAVMNFFFNSSVWKVTTGDCFLVKTARRTVRDLVLWMAKHRRISAVVANFCTHHT